MLKGRSLRAGARDVPPVEQDRDRCRRSSRPARIRSSVVLPQPLGPSRLKKVPAGIVRPTLSSAVTSPNRLVTPSMRDLAAPAALEAHSPASEPSGPMRPVRLKKGTAIASASHGTAISRVATALIEGSIERCSFE